MKTELALLMQTDGKPAMPLDKVAENLGISARTLENKLYAKASPVKMFKMGSGWFAHVSDVAAYIDERRAAAVAEAA